MNIGEVKLQESREEYALYIIDGSRNSSGCFTFNFFKSLITYVLTCWCDLIPGVARSTATCYPADTCLFVHTTLSKYLAYEEAC
uniref:Uncharacterized protein n=1 Tax=Strongyloides venezuelensis TaxID=75913 RepID=A0A0K0EXR8_STRVS